MDYVGLDDPGRDHEAAAEKARVQAEGDAADAEVSALTARADGKNATNLEDPVPAEKRARPLVAAGFGEDAPHGWEVAAGGLSSTKRVWLPDFVHRLRSVFIPLPRPEWLAEQAKKQGAEAATLGTRELTDLEKQAISDAWSELDKDSTGSLPSSKLIDVIELVYGYEATQKEQHALLLATRYGHIDASDASVTEGEFLDAMATVIELRQCEHFFKWRRAFKRLVRLCWIPTAARSHTLPRS